MHEYLRAVGFSEAHTRKQLKELVEWVLDKPERVSITSKSGGSNVAEASREVGGRAGVTVIGEVDEYGNIIPEYYFPYISSTRISSESVTSCTHESAREGYIGMCEDYRVGLALIFHVTNVVDVVRGMEDLDLKFTRVCFSALAKDATVILPLDQPERVPDRARNREEDAQLLENAAKGDIGAIAHVADEEIRRYKYIMEHLRDTDVFTMVESFFMPHGLESDQYYLMGTIQSANLVSNKMTGERFWRMLVESNGIPITVAVNEKDIQGVPQAHCRLKCHVWLTGALKR